MNDAVCSKQDTLRLLAETARLRHENERLRGELEKIARGNQNGFTTLKIARRALAGESK